MFRLEVLTPCRSITVTTLNRPQRNDYGCSPAVRKAGRGSTGVETLGNVASAETGGDQSDRTETTARELMFLAGPFDPWLLDEDGVTDSTAIDTAVYGMRQVRLTLAERITAATRILAGGEGVRSVCRRLGLPDDTEYKWNQLQRLESPLFHGIAVVMCVCASWLTQLN